MFTVPWAFAALVALPALAGIYWLRNSYRRVPVSSLMLWLEQADSRASGLRVKRLQTPLLFFLELVILALLVLAATGPKIRSYFGSGPLIVILDDSYSMLAGEEQSPRRLAEQTLADQLGWNAAQEVRLLVAGTAPRFLGEPAESRAQLLGQLAGWQCRSPAANLTQALALATEVGGGQARLLVITDQPAPADFPPGQVRWWAFGENKPNVALVQAQRTSEEARERLALEIANLSGEIRSTTLTIEGDDKTLHQAKLNLAAGGSRRVLLQLADALPEVVHVRLDPDALAVDNEAWLVRQESPRVRVRLGVASEALRKLLEKVLAATERVTFVDKEAQLLITDSAEVPEAAAETWLVQVIVEKEAEAFAAPFVLDRSHPLTQGLDMSGVVWGAGTSVGLPGVPVIMAGNVTLVSTSEASSGQQRVRLRLRPDLSTLVDTPAWPVLMWNLVTWRVAELPGLARSNVRLGETTLLKLPIEVEEVTSVTPGEVARRLPMFAHRTSIMPGNVGVTEIHAGKKTYRVGVSTLNREESDLGKSETGRWGEWNEDAGPLWSQLTWAFLLAALGVLTVHQVLARR